MKGVEFGDGFALAGLRGSQANDALIKATGQAEGIRSYGRVVDLMLAYFSVENE